MKGDHLESFIQLFHSIYFLWLACEGGPKNAQVINMSRIACYLPTNDNTFLNSSVASQPGLRLLTCTSLHDLKKKIYLGNTLDRSNLPSQNLKDPFV
jgi:hypothetical protein